MEDGNGDVQDAIPSKHYHAKGDQLVFFHGEIEKYIDVKIIKDNIKDTDVMQFNVRLHDPEPEGCKLTKKDVCIMDISGDDEAHNVVQDLEKIYELMQKKENVSWAGQFKQACMLHPQVDEEGNVDDITALEAFMHFLSIFWKFFFSLIPPVRWLGGWVAFVVALGFIGLVTFVVGEIAGLFGCVVFLKPAVTAITFVALGTSLPDTFASKTAAQESKTADSAVGNVTGSNSVNVFLGLGLPWMLASIYYAAKGDKYSVPAGDLAFSVALFLGTSVLCLITLIVRRIVLGGELGGNKVWKIVSAVWLIFLWLIYVIFSTLKVYEVL